VLGGGRDIRRKQDRLDRTDVPGKCSDWARGPAARRTMATVAVQDLACSV
jgi:hypothetical protein